MRERRKPLNGINHSLTLQALTPALSRWESEFIGFCGSLGAGEKELSSGKCLKLSIIIIRKYMV